MLVGIIKIQKKTYNIFLEQITSNPLLTITLENNGIIKKLNEIEIHNLIATLLSSELTYKEKQGEYDIYLDEAGNRRYYKNGKEDYLKSFYNNGSEAFDYIAYNDIVEILERAIPGFKTKEFQLILKKMSAIIIISPILLSAYNQEINTPSYDNTPAVIEEITTEEALDLINQTPHLTEEEKEFISNKYLITYVIEASKNRENDTLRTALTNDKIERFENDGKTKKLGYVDPLKPNIMFLREDLDPNKSDYYKVLDHEFVHVIQGYTKYHYIKEALTDIIVSEFRILDDENSAESTNIFTESNYGSPVIGGYYEEVKNLKILLEIIGPQSIIESVYNENDEPFENEIKNYLTPKDAKRLLKLFKTTGKQLRIMGAEKRNELNEEIYNLLSEMYKNKFGENIRQNILITKIRHEDDTIKRLYFNKYRTEYYQPTIIKTERHLRDNTPKEIKIEDKEVSRILYFQTFECKEEDIDEIEKLEGFSQLTRKLNTAEGVEYEFNNSFKYQGKIYSEEEAKALGLYTYNFYYEIATEIQNIDSAEPKKGNRIRIEYKDGSETNIFCTDDENKWDYIDELKITTIEIPPICEKFSSKTELPEISYDEATEKAIKTA